jgi:protein-tyrosine phosphatase
MDRQTIVSAIGVGKLLRGGHIAFIDSPALIGNPKTILNVRVEPDECKWAHLGVEYFQIPAGKAQENYNIEEEDVYAWILKTISFISNLSSGQLPIYIHCRFGKDRTGIIVAVILKLLGVPREVIVLEYLTSSFGHVNRESIERVLSTFPDDIHEARRLFPEANFKNMVQILRSEDNE